MAGTVDVVLRRELPGRVTALREQEPPVVAQRMDDDRGVLPRLDDFIQVDNGSVFHTQSERTIHPDGLLAFQQIAPDQIGRSEVFMAGHRNERTP